MNRSTCNGAVYDGPLTGIAIPPLVLDRGLAAVVLAAPADAFAVDPRLTLELHQ